MTTDSGTYQQDPAPKPLILKERDIEAEFIEKLGSLKYGNRPDICDRAALHRNFREKFEALNRVRLTDAEFQRLLDEIINPDVFTASHTLRNITSFVREDGTPLNFTLVNIKDWCKNTFEVVNQLRINTDNSHHRYDVILLINGVPVVQIELKALGISPRRAMEQIVEYKNDPGNGYTRTLLCFMQLFIVSNHSDTWYFANNNTRHFAFNADERFLPIYQYADEANKKVTHLDAFADSFLVKCTLGQMISRYMVLVASEQKLMMMRPYQVYAVKQIVDCIHQNSGNGYIWHTTGSGKTLTSFKASTLLKDNADIEKCIFVVDRKDLDRQTREEFNRFQEKCVEENTNTAALVRRLLSDDYADKVIVTTIQKLGLALDETSKRNKQKKKDDKPTYKEQLKPLREKRIAFIFDECHRSQFGENHDAIKTFFPKAQLFGFTGTPIFEANASRIKIEDQQASMRTTQDLFQKQLHAYTITHAIEDGNVLRFHVDYFKPREEEVKKLPAPGQPFAKKAIIEAILAKHDAATAGRRFNAFLATASINDAIEYHGLFDEAQKARQLTDPGYAPLNIACVFSPPAEGNPDVKKAGEFYTPQQISDILSAIVTLDSQEPATGKKDRLASVLDFACGSGSLLLNVRKRMGPHGIGKIYGQEKNITTYNLARMNMLLHGVKDSEFEIYHGDTLLNDWDILRELNPAKKPAFDAIVANPPFSYRWEPTDAMGEDVRFKNHGLAPKSAADFAFLLHGFHFLKDEGVMAIILPHGVLFRGGAEERIRTKLLKDGHIDTVIGLPANLFYSTGIPVCILVLKKCKKPDDVLFINAAEHFVKGKRQNQLTEEHIKKIIDTYQYRKPAPRYARRVDMAEIEKNEYNLNISRYISTAEKDVEIDLSATHAELVKIEKQIQDATRRHNEFLKELNLSPLPIENPDNSH